MASNKYNKSRTSTEAFECEFIPMFKSHRSSSHDSNLNLILTFPFFDNFNPMFVLPLQHAKLGKLGKWKIWVLICLLTCPVVVLQVQVVPSSRPPDYQQCNRKSCGWQVSSEGRCRDTRGRLSHGYLHTNGYCAVMISRKVFLVHRLIAHAFHGPPLGEAACEVNHIDGNRSNNQLDNLEWVTPSQNVRHSYAKLERHPSSRERQAMIRPVGSQEWTRFSSIKLASEEMGQPYMMLYGRCRRKAQLDGYEYRLAPVQRAECSGEEWRPMKCPRSGLLVEGRSVSSLGRIKSKSGRIYFGSLEQDGYFRTQVKLGMRRKSEYVHRLVAASFLGQPPSPEHSQINHRDMNRSNNAVENLEHVTPAENSAHRSGNMKGPHHASKAVLSRRYGTNEEWTHHPSQTSAADCLALDRDCVSKCTRGVLKQTGGYQFRFAEPEALVVETLPGEEWREVDLEAHLRERETRRNRLPSHG